MRALSILAVVGSAFGALIALVTYRVMCFGESWGSTMCPDGEATTTMTAQLLFGLAGLLPPAAMAYFAFRGERRRAVVALETGLVLWILWAFLNERRRPPVGAGHAAVAVAG